MKIIIVDHKHKAVNSFIHQQILPMMYNMIVKLFDRDVYNLYSVDLKSSIQDMLLRRDYLYVTVSPDNTYTIMIDENQIVGRSSAKLCDICNIINFGSLDYPATHVFTKVFSYIRQNFWRLYKSYIRGGMRF